MMTILNRLRGTEGLWSKIIGLLLALIIQIAFNNPYVSVAVGLGYIIGESFGWGEWIGTITGDRNFKQLNEEGKNTGIQWLASKVIDPSKDWINYCRVALSIRGFYWWLPTLAPLYFVGFSVELLTFMILALSIGFPLACEIGYYTSKLWNFKHMNCGWEHSEVWYGLVQDVVLISLFILI